MKIYFYISDIEAGDVERAVDHFSETHTMHNISFLRYWQTEQGEKALFTFDDYGMKMKRFAIRSGGFYFTDIFEETHKMTPVRENSDAGSGALMVDFRRKEYRGIL